MPFTTYKILHIICILFTASFLSVSFLCSYKEKWIKITSGILSLLIAVTGFSLVAKLGFTDVQWPLWIKIKIGIWMAIAIAAPILAKRLTKNRALVFFGFMGLFCVAITLTILKPF
jgi:uncharacterized membrane protein SirB2